jgi:hypothetical protein
MALAFVISHAIPRDLEPIIIPSLIDLSAYLIPLYTREWESGKYHRHVVMKSPHPGGRRQCKHSRTTTAQSAGWANLLSIHHSTVGIPARTSLTLRLRVCGSLSARPLSR